jgi:hypothetical protein
VTSAVDHDEKTHPNTHQAIKTKEEKHVIDPNDVLPGEKHDTPKKVKESLEIMKDPKVEAKKAVANANKTSSVSAKNSSTPTVLKLKADS